MQAGRQASLGANVSNLALGEGEGSSQVAANVALEGVQDQHGSGQ